MYVRKLSHLIAAISAAALLGAASSSYAGTIIKLNLGGTGPDVGMTAAGLFSTLNDGVVGTTGDQNTDIEFTDFMNAIPDVNTNAASFSLSGLQATGAATQVGALVIQNFSGGLFSLYNAANTLLVQGPLSNSVLTGTAGPPGTGGFFTTTLTSATAGALAPMITPGSLSLTFNLSNINGGGGLTVVPLGGPGVLQQFSADAGSSMAANFTGVPEPGTLVLFGLIVGLGIPMARRRRN